MSEETRYQSCPDGCYNSFCSICYEQVDKQTDNRLFKIICNSCDKEMELDFIDSDKNMTHYSCGECNLEIQIVSTVTVELGDTLEDIK